MECYSTVACVSVVLACSIDRNTLGVGLSFREWQRRTRMNELNRVVVGERRHHDCYIKAEFNLQLINYLIATSSAFPTRNDSGRRRALELFFFYLAFNTKSDFAIKSCFSLSLGARLCGDTRWILNNFQGTMFWGIPECLFSSLPKRIAAEWKSCLQLFFWWTVSKLVTYLVTAEYVHC